jgi:hypothetical protein
MSAEYQLMRMLPLDARLATSSGPTYGAVAQWCRSPGEGWVAKNRCSEARPTRHAGIPISAPGTVLCHRLKYQAYEPLHRYPSSDYADEVPITSDVDQTEAETAILVKQKTIMFLVRARRGLNSSTCLIMQITPPLAPRNQV